LILKRALILFLATAGLAAVCGVSGVLVLFGPGWALIAAAVALGGAAEAIRRGLSANA
jgi:hypothetical protein